MHLHPENPQPVSHKHVLLSEILAVTSAMRKNSRWASTTHFVNARDSALASHLGLRFHNAADAPRGSASANRENDLMFGFQELKRTIRDVDDVAALPLSDLLAPFFAIIRSPLSTGPITSAALSALHNFFVCGLVSPSSISLETALVELSSTVSHCKFEASDSSGDEVVLLRIMTVIQDCMCRDVGAFLGDLEVCEMLETVLTTCCQIRLSEILRRFAETTMHALVRTVFTRLHQLDPLEEEPRAKLVEDELQQAEIRMTVSTSTAPAATSLAQPDGDPSAEKHDADDSVAVAQSDQSAAQGTRSQFGLPSILELSRVLVNVLDPNDQQHTDSTRLIALSILNAALEAGGPTISRFPSLESIILDPGCKFLFQLARSENFSVLHLTLRTITTVFETMRSHLKLQQELFLSFTIDRLAPPQGATSTGSRFLNNVGNTLHGKQSSHSRPSTPLLGVVELESSDSQPPPTPPRLTVPPAARGEVRDLLLETLAQLSRHPGFMVDLYTNYDCDINCENLFERLVDFLTKGVYPLRGGIDSQLQHQNSQYLCLELLLSFVNDMAMRHETTSEPWCSTYANPITLTQSKSRKKLVLTGAALFNSKPKTGLTFLEENQLIYADLSPEVTHARSLATFLKGCTRLDKRLLGDFISKPDNIEVLKAFIGLFDFKNKPMADAMRELLETFRLPGEAQQISRITETFASIYFAAKPAEIKSEDAVYVLAYSIIMLNTDLHNPQIRKRMSIEDYQKNLRGVNGGSDFSPEYLQNIYDSIRKREIVMPEEHTGQLGFEYAWKELLARSRQAGDLMICNTSVFDLDMFKSVWKSVISAIAYSFITFDDDYIIQRAITGFRQCATLAGQFHLPDVFDFVVVSLSQATSLLSDSLSAQVPNSPVVEVEGQSITVSSLSVKFGTNVKGQLAAVVLFNIVNGNGNALREGWTQIFEMFQNLFIHSLLPMRMLQMEDFLGGVTMIPLRGSQPPRRVGRSDGGLLSALSSYLMTPYASSADMLVPDATDTDVENTLCTIDCITSCRLDELYGQITQLELDALIAAIRSLEALAHERTVARLRQEADELNSSPHEDGSACLPYDPASVFLLEMMVSIACQTPHYIEDVWPIVFEHLSELLSTSAQYSILLIERAVVGLLRLCLILSTKSSLRDQIYVSFDLLSSLPSSVANAVGEQILGGVNLLVQKHREVISSQTEWNLVFTLLRLALSNPGAATQSFDLTSGLASEGSVTADNFAGLVTLLDDFASMASASMESQLRQGHRKESPRDADSPTIQRGRKAVDILFDLKVFIAPFIQASAMPTLQAWRHFCLPLLTSLSRQSTSASRHIRHSAISHLQRILLGPHIIFPPPSSSRSQIDEIFNRIIFPLIDDLLRPQTLQKDPQGIPETRLRASALLCKAFMHFEVRERGRGEGDLRIIWVQILDLLDRLMNVDRGDQLYEEVPESLKNVLLVMNAADILVPPPTDVSDDPRDERQRMFWISTQERMERFLPGFLVDVIPTRSTHETT